MREKSKFEIMRDSAIFLMLLLWVLCVSGLETLEDRRREAVMVPVEVVMADYALLRQSFPLLEDKSDGQIDHWLQLEAGYMRVRHLLSIKVFQPIHSSPLVCWSSIVPAFDSCNFSSFFSASHFGSDSSSSSSSPSSSSSCWPVKPVNASELREGKEVYPFDCNLLPNPKLQTLFVIKKTGHFPPKSGRALHLPLRGNESSLINVKGSGSDRPRKASLYANGVLALQEAIDEFLMEKVVARIGEVETERMGQEKLSTVRSFAVLRLKGLNLEGEQRKPLGLLVRQAVSRPFLYLAPREDQIYFERTLQRYGLSGTTPTFWLHYESETEMCFDAWRHALPQRPIWVLTAANETHFGTKIRQKYTDNPLFLDYQITTNPYQLIDFSVISFITPWKGFFNGTAVYPVWQIYDHYGSKCITTINQLHLKSAKECLAALSNPIPLEQMQELPVTYVFPALNVPTWRLRWLQLWPLEERKAIGAFYFLPLDQKLALEPGFFQELFHRLRDYLAAWCPHSPNQSSFTNQSSSIRPPSDFGHEGEKIMVLQVNDVF